MDWDSAVKAVSADEGKTTESAPEAPATPQPSPAQPASENPWSTAVQAVSQQEETRQKLQGALSVTVNRPADEEAKLYDLSKRTGIPIEAARLNRDEVEKLDKLNQADIPGLTQNHPLTAETLSDPSKAALLHDSIPFLTQLEHVWDGGGDVLAGSLFPSLTTANALGRGSFRQPWQSFKGGVAQAENQGELAPVINTLRGGKGTKDTVKQYIKLKQDQTRLGLDENTDTGAAWWARQVGYSGRQFLSGLTEGAKFGLPAAAAGAGVGAVAGSLFPPIEGVTIPGMALSSGIAAARLGVARQSFEQESAFAYDEFSQLRDETGKLIDPRIANTAANAVGAINALLDTAEFGIIAKTIPGVAALQGKAGRAMVGDLLKKPTVQAAILKAMGQGALVVGKESGLEGVQEVATILGREGAQALSGGDYKPDDTGTDISRVLQTVAKTAAGMMGISAPGAAFNAHLNAVRVQDRATQTKLLLEADAAAVQDSPAFKRVPQLIQDFIKRRNQNAGIEDVFIPATFFQSHFKEAGIDPAAVATKLGADNYAEALATGGDMAIPYDAFVREISPLPEHFGPLANAVKMNPGDRSVMESEEDRKQAEAYYQKLHEDMRQAVEDDLQSEPALSAIEDIKGQLMATGMDASTAQTTAQVMRAFNVLAERHNAGGGQTISGQDLFEQYALKVQRPLPGVLASKGQTDTGLDPVIDALKTGQPFNRAGVYGPSLAEFLISRGGLKDDGGELAARDLDKHRFNRRKITKDSGLSLDQAAQLAAEHGFFPENTIGTITQNELLDALDNELRGNPIFAPRNLNETLLNFHTAVEQLGEYLDRLGVDWKGLDNEQIKQAIVDANGDIGQMEGQTFNQSEATGSQFVQQVNEVLSGKRELRLPLLVGKSTPTVYQTLGMKDLPVVVTGKVIDKMHYDHGLSAGALSSLPEKLADPVMVFASDTENDAYVAVLDMFSKGNPVVAVIKPNAKMGRYDVNIVASAYPKDKPEAILGWWKSGLLRYINQQKSPAWSTTARLQLPGVVHSARGSQGKILTEKDLGRRYQGDKDPKGYITIGDNRQISISLLEKADLSTFLHETGHLYLEVLGDLAERADAAPQIVQDYTAILHWLGAENRHAITTDQHEQFARGFEAYLREGNAPTLSLMEPFARFKAWLTRIYKKMSALNVHLTDEVRGVFDRILATDEEIQQAKEAADLKALFADAESAGMGEKEFSAYQKLLASSMQKARDKLLADKLKAFEQENTDWWKQERERVRAQVAEEVVNSPTEQAWGVLRKGELPTGQPIKLSKQSLVDAFGAAYLKRVWVGLYSVVDGVDIDTAAELLGFDSGRQLVEALVNRRPPAELIKAETDRRMIEQHGANATQAEAAEKAMSALQNDSQAEVLLAELRVLNRKRSEVGSILSGIRQDQAKELRSGVKHLQDIPPLETFRAVAVATIGAKKAKDIKPQLYLSAMRKASHAAYVAAGHGDWTTATSEKQKELMNHYLYLEANRAQDDIEQIYRAAGQYQKKTTRERIGKAGGNYLDQIDFLLEQFEFKKISLLDIGRREKLREWYDSKVLEGYEPAISPELMEQTFRINYREATTDQLRGLYDAWRSIETLAGLKNKLLASRQQKDFDEAVDDLVAQAKSLPRLRQFRPDMKRWLDNVKDGFINLDASLVPMEKLIEALDGGKRFGPWHDALWNPISEAQAKQLDMDAAIAEPINALIDDLVKANPFKLLDEIDTFVGRMKRKEAMSIAFNLGNASNTDKLLRGMEWAADDVATITDQLTEAEWNFIQGVWDILDQELWPKVAELEKTLSGVAPPKIEATPFTVQTSDGKTVNLRGGYYPIKYDPLHSTPGLMQEAPPISNLTEQGYARATTPHGFTKERNEKAAFPLLLDFAQILQGHLAGVIKDLAFRPALLDANRLLHNQAIRGTLQERLGAKYEETMMEWLRRVANDRNTLPSDGLDVFSAMIEGARAKVVTAALGLKLSTVIAQFAGLPNVLAEVGPHAFASGFKQAMQDPAYLVGKGQLYETVISKSGEMRHRFETLDNTIRDELRRLRENHVQDWKTEIERAAFYGIGLADRAITVPAWLAGYNQALHDPSNANANFTEAEIETRAIHAGDAAVRRSQGAGAAKDLNKFQAQRGFVRAVSMFYTPFAAMYGQNRDVVMALKKHGVAYTPMAIMRLALIDALPALIADALSGRLGQTCAEGDMVCLAKAAGLKALFSPASTLPIGREIANQLESYLETGKLKEPTWSPIAMALVSVEKAAQHGMQAAAGDIPMDDKIAFDAFEALGYATGLPTVQPRITLEYLYDLAAGDAHPDTPGKLLHDLIFRRKASENQ